MKLFGHSEAWVRRHEQAEQVKAQQDLARKVDESNARYADLEVDLSDFEDAELPENNIDLADSTPAEVDPDSKTASEAPRDEFVRTRSLVADNFQDFKLEGYVASASRGNHITFYREDGSTAFDGTTNEAVEHYLKLSPEQLAGVYGGGDQGLDAGLSAIQDLIDADNSGNAETVLQENKALQASFAAYLRPTRDRVVASAI